MELTKNILKYIKIMNQMDELDDNEQYNILEEKLENLYFELDEEEINFLEKKGYI